MYIDFIIGLLIGALAVVGMIILREDEENSNKDL